MGRLYIRPHRRSRCRPQRPLAALLLLLLLSLLVYWLSRPEAAAVATHRPIRAFDSVPLRDAMPAQREAATAFRTILPSLASDGAPAGRWFSLNPADPAQPPQILDGASRQLLQISVEHPPTGPWRIERVLELGAFQQGLAPARALVRAETGDGGLSSSARQRPRYAELWGYVDPRGQWRIPPRYAQAGNWASGLARVALPDSPPRWQLIDQGGQTRHATLIEAIKQDWLLQPWGRHAMLSRQDEHWLFPADGDTPVLLPCCRVEYSDPSGTLNLLSSREETLFHLKRGRIADARPLAGRVPLRPLLEQVYGEIRRRDGGELVYRVRSIDPAQPTLADGLSDVQPFLPDAFVACVAGREPLLVRSGGTPRYRQDRGQRCGLMDGGGRWRLPPDYHSLIQQDNGVLRLGRGRDWCAARQDGSPIGACAATPPAALLSAGLLPDARLGEEEQEILGYRDDSGGWRVTPQFQEAGPFVGHIARVSQHGLPGLIDAQGRWLTPEPPLNLIVVAWETAQRRNDPETHDFGLINRRGEMVLPFVFRAVRDPDEDGSALACPMPASLPCQRIDLSGRRVADPLPVAKTLSRHRHLSHPPPEWTPAERAGRWGYLGRDGSWAIAPRFDEVQPFEADVAWVRQGARWGLIDRRGQWRQPAVFVEARAFVAGISAVRHENGRMTLLSPNGRSIELEGVEEVGPFSSGLALARTAGGYGYITPSGLWAIKPRYRQATPFVGDYAVVAAPLPPNWTPPPNHRSPYLVQTVDLWPAAKLARVAVLANGETRFGLVDDMGRWLLPRY